MKNLLSILERIRKELGECEVTVNTAVGIEYLKSLEMEKHIIIIVQWSDTGKFRVFHEFTYNQINNVKSDLIEYFIIYAKAKKEYMIHRINYNYPEYGFSNDNIPSDKYKQYEKTLEELDKYERHEPDKGYS